MKRVIQQLWKFNTEFSFQRSLLKIVSLIILINDSTHLLTKLDDLSFLFFFIWQSVDTIQYHMILKLNKQGGPEEKSSIAYRICQSWSIQFMPVLF